MTIETGGIEGAKQSILKGQLFFALVAGLCVIRVWTLVLIVKGGAGRGELFSWLATAEVYAGCNG